MIAGWHPFFFLKSTSFTSSTFPIQPDLSQNQPAAITLNTGSPRTLVCPSRCFEEREKEGEKQIQTCIVLYCTVPIHNLVGMMRRYNVASIRKPLNIIITIDHERHHKPYITAQKYTILPAFCLVIRV